MMKITIPYFSFRYDVDFLLTKQSVLYNKIWRYAFYSHISSSLIVLFTGIIQFYKPLIIHRPLLHRFVGKIYILLVLFISAPSGLVMAFYANGGLWARTSFILISVLWWFFTLRAYTKIKTKKIDEHIDNMIRSYALTLSAITLRLYVVALPGFIHLSARDMYTFVAWLSWVPNLLIAEWIIRNRIFGLKSTN
jgi:hypothetical protein